MAVTVKKFCLAASILLVLRLTDCSPLSSLNKTKSTSEPNEGAVDAGDSDSNVKDNKIVSCIKNAGSNAVQIGMTAGSNAIQKGKTTGSNAVQIGKTTGTNAFRLGINLPGFLLGKAKSVYDKFEEERNELTKIDSGNKPGILKRAVIIPTAIRNVGVNLATDVGKDYASQFNTQFNSHDKSTPDDTKDITVNLKRIIKHPIVFTRTVTGVAANQLKTTANSVINKNNDNKDQPKPEAANKPNKASEEAEAKW